MKVMQNAASNSGHRSEVRLPVGFTLIELLVVISVIGILASLIVGVSGVATSKARISQTQALLNKIGKTYNINHCKI